MKWKKFKDDLIVNTAVFFIKSYRMIKKFVINISIFFGKGILALISLFIGGLNLLFGLNDKFDFQISEIPVTNPIINKVIGVMVFEGLVAIIIGIVLLGFAIYINPNRVKEVRK